MYKQSLESIPRKWEANEVPDVSRKGEKDRVKRRRDRINSRIIVGNEMKNSKNKYFKE